MRKQKGITLIALVVTIIVLLILASISLSAIKGEGGILNDTKYAKYSAKIRDYQTELNEYIITKEEQSYAGEEVRIYAETPEEIKKIIKGISDEDAEKFVIQDNELRYNDRTTTEKEKEWLGKIGILVMTTIFTISFMGKDQIYKTIRATQIEFPRTPPVTDGMDFTGWYYDTELTSEAVEGEKLTADITLYPKWEARKYKVAFMVNGNQYKEIKSSTVIYPTEEPKETAQVFDGWYYDEECTKEANAGDKISKNTTLYANMLGIKNPLNGKTLVDESKTKGEFQIHKYEYMGNVEVKKVGNHLQWYNISTDVDGTITANTLMGTNIKITKSGNLILVHTTTGKNESSYSGYIGNYRITFNVQKKNGEIIELQDNVNIETWTNYCLAKGTQITLANYTTKNIEDITYEDQILVWDFDNGCFSTAKPLWIKKVQETNEYNNIKFEDGRELKTIGDHRVFNIDKQKFLYGMNEQDTPLGTKVFLEDGTTTRITEREVIHEKIEYYNIITDYHMNLFANGILTSLRLNNLYEIKDMKFIKDDRELVKREEYKNIPDKYFNGLRLAEQPKEINKGNDVKHTNTLEEYVQRIINMEK